MQHVNYDSFTDSILALTMAPSTIPSQANPNAKLKSQHPRFQKFPKSSNSIENDTSTNEELANKYKRSRELYIYL